MAAEEDGAQGDIDEAEAKAAREAEEEALEAERAAEEKAERAKAAKEAKAAKAGKKRRPYNYLLEQMVEFKAPAEGEKEPPRRWDEVKDGFVSPEQALEHVSKAKLVGRFRAVRVASDEHEAAMTTPEPVHTLRKVKGK